MVAMPKKAMIHIQKMAPGPPMRIAPEAPTMLPVPTCAAMAVASAWNELMPLLCFSPLRLKLAEHPPHALAEAAHLHKAGADREIQTRANEQDDQHIV